MFYTIYQTTNLINGKKYIGKHVTKDPYDSYLGSGLRLKNSINKYGIENFKKDVLFIFDNEEDMNKKEKELVTLDVTLSEEYYNIALGGYGGAIVLKVGHPLYEQVCKKLKETQSSKSHIYSEITKSNHKTKRVGMYGKKQSEKQKRIVSEKMKGQKKNTESVQKQKQSLQKTFDDPNYIHPNRGKKYDAERLKKMSEETKSRPKKMCTYCNRTLDRANFAKYHGEKCKLKADNP